MLFIIIPYFIYSIAQVIVMYQWLRLMEAYTALVTWRETQSLTSVTRNTVSQVIQSGPVSLMDSGQGFRQSAIVCSFLHIIQ